jgi:hypothetical protein
MMTALGNNPFFLENRMLSQSSTPFSGLKIYVSEVVKNLVIYLFSN